MSCTKCGDQTTQTLCARCKTDERMTAGAAVVAKTLRAWTEPLDRMARESIDDYVQYVKRVSAAADARNAEMMAAPRGDSALN